MIELLAKHLFFKDKQIESCVLLDNQGYCNENYLVVVNTTKYIVRKLLRDDIDRDFEWQVHTLAYKQGITAEPLVFDEKQGFMIFEFLEGKHQLSTSKSDLKKLALTLQKLHNIGVDAKSIELVIENRTDKVIKAFKTIDNYPKEYALCHNDLNPQNIFFNGDVKLIDWEYAGINDRYFDLACVCVEFVLNTEMQEVFLDAYFEGLYTFEKIEAYKVVYVELREEWFEKNL